MIGAFPGYLAGHSQWGHEALTRKHPVTMTTDTESTAVTAKPEWAVVPKSKEAIIEGLQGQVAQLLEDAKVTAVRHNLAKAYTEMHTKAYSALKAYGVDYQTLPEFGDPDGLMVAAAEAPLLEGASAMNEYITRLAHGIDAAIRRKQFRQVT